MTYQKWSQKLKSDRKNLQHHDLEVLALEVLDTTQGETIEFLINNLAKTVGKPVQIISDHGSDIKKADATPRRRKTQGKRTKQELNFIFLKILK